MASKREGMERLANAWESEASDRERTADKPGGDHTPIEKRMLRVQATVYRACAMQLRNELRNMARG